MTTNTTLKNTSSSQTDEATVTPHQIVTHQVATHQIDTRNMLIHEVVLDAPYATVEEATASLPLRAHHQFTAGPNGPVYSGIVWVAQPTPISNNRHARAA